MSLIHEALEKIEQGKKEDEKKLVSATAVEEIEKENLKVPPPAERASDPASRIIYVVGGILLVLFLSGLVYLGVHTLQRSKREEMKAEPTVLPSTRNFDLGRYFSLTGITRIDSKGMAIVNNQVVRVGDEVSGAKVIAIGDEEVTLEFKGETVQLNLYR